MKIVIDIQDGIYAWLKDGYSDEFDRKRLVKAVQNGTPLTEVFEDIKAEIEEKYNTIPETFHHYETGFTDALEWSLGVIDRHINGEGSEE